MPWFIYNYPNDPNQQGSYTLATGGTPTCTGSSLCAIYAQSQPNSNPAKPVLTQSVLDAISAANGGVITSGVTLLRP